MTKFTFEIQPFPKSYTVEAETEDFAKDVAHSMFYKETGRSIFETVLVEQEEVSKYENMNDEKALELLNCVRESLPEIKKDMTSLIDYVEKKLEA